jgi:cell division protein FtsW (lipid II flippase)
MSASSSSIPWLSRLGWNRASYLLLSLFFSTIFLIGLVWWPLLSDYVDSFDPGVAWWRQVDWLLLGVFGAMTVLIMARADVKRDLLTVAVGLMGGLVIESWGTQTGLWTYYTLERPPLWIIPAWPIASLAIDRLTGFLAPSAARLGRRTTALAYAATFGAFFILMLSFVRPTMGLSLTITAIFLCAFLIATPVQPRTALATFAAGAALGYFLELWGTTRGCWIYYTLETPPLFAVLAHGMAAVAFWRASEALTKVGRAGYCFGSARVGIPS